MKVPKIPRLIVAASETCADLLYATHFMAPDAFVFLQQNGRSMVMLSDLEVDRGRKSAKVNRVIGMSEVAKKLERGIDSPFPELVAQFLRDQKVRRAIVPEAFPLGLATELRKFGIELEPQPGLFWPEREKKSESELHALEGALRITETGMKRAMEVLRASEIGNKNGLRWLGKILTSEILRAEIETAILRAGGLPAHTIVAGGEQACDPHERGSGPLRANELIILDIFPRDAQSSYFGDMTRTVVRGRASEQQRKLWTTVKRGQEFALKSMQPGKSGKVVHEAVKQMFADAGFPTEVRAGRNVGFFHGTGHGLGLEIHEEPRFSKTNFKIGQVLTVEPGLYYPGVGGVRIEDVATVTKTGARVLSRFPKVLEI